MTGKIIPMAVAAAVAIGGGSFYGGMKFGESRAPQSAFGAGNGKMIFRNFDVSSQDGQRVWVQGGGQFGPMDGSGSGRGPTGGFANGEIISKDGSSVTVETRGGGSKIVFYSDSTEIGKFVDGTKEDLDVGKAVTIIGKANDDGSLTAQSIQLRPEAPTPAVTP
jgi:hypothetical protein